MSTDLFGIETREPIISPQTGKAKRVTIAKGYARRPGSGPASETCKSCEHSVRVQGGGSYFWKCAKMRHFWTGGPGSDIRLSSPACAEWQKAEEKPAPEGYRWLRCGEKFQPADRWLDTASGQIRPYPEIVGRRVKSACEGHCIRPIATKGGAA